MTDRELYTLTIPEDSQTSVQTQAQRNTSARGVLGEDAGSVESLSAAPDQRKLRGQYRGTYAELMATELAELFEASEYGAVSYTGTSAVTPADGYYTPADLSVRRLDPRDGGVVAFDGRMTRVGTRDSHRRAVETAVVQVENAFGNDQTASVGVPAKATDVRWLNDETGQTTLPSPVTTRSAEFGDVTLYDALAPSFDNPTLVYDLPYDEEGKTDAKVWDDRGASAKHDADDITQWQRVFITDHGFVGSPVFDNGLARMTFDRTNGLSAEQWDDANGTWSAVSLGTSDWEFDRVDLTRVGPSRIDARCRFRDATQSPTATYELVFGLVRGYQYPQWTRPENETDPVPTGLVELLDPVANPNDYDAQPVQELVARTEIQL